VLMNAKSGEILAMASHPGFDANNIGQLAPALHQEASTPLLNRAAQGTYRVENAALPMIEAAKYDAQSATVTRIYQELGLFDPAEIRLPVGVPIAGTGITDARVSPLQIAAAAAAISGGGIEPAPRIVLAVQTPAQVWVVLPSLGESRAVYSPEAAKSAATDYGVAGTPFWQWRLTATSTAQTLTWYLGGTQPDWQGPPLVVVVLLEDRDVTAATELGLGLLRSASAQR